MLVAVRNSLLKKLPGIAYGSVSLLAALYLAFSPRLAPKLYARRLFRPFQFPEGDWDVDSVAGWPRQDVYFRAVDGSRLHGWYFENPEATHVALFSHGNTGNIAGRVNLVRLLLHSRLSVFIYDYRGYGRSEGSPSIRGICEDGLMAFDYLLRKGYKPSQIIVYGESLGTAVASEIAADRPCAGIILQSGFSSLRKIGYERVPLTRIYPTALFPKPLLDSAERMSKESKPLLIIHGAKDVVVPFAHGEEIFMRAAHPKKLVRLHNAAHSDIWATDPDEYVKAVTDFAQSLPADADVVG